MARRYSRFSKLFREYKAAGGNADPGSKLDYFGQFLKGQRQIEVTNKIPTDGRRLFPVPIYAFGIDFDAAASAACAVAATASAYSLSGLHQRLGASTGTLLGHNLPEADADVARLEKGFYAALVKVKMTAQGSAVLPSKRSGITNEEYKYQYGRAFGLPFGRAVATPEEDYTERMTAIVEELKDVNGVVAITFEAELWRRTANNGEFDPNVDGVPVP